MAKPKDETAGVDPVALALAGVLVISTWGAWRVYAAASSVLQVSQTRDAYVLFLTDGKLTSDNSDITTRAESAQIALVAAQTEAVLLMVACAILAGGLAWRTFRPVSKDPRK